MATGVHAPYPGMKEKNTHKQGRSGSKVKEIAGPANKGKDLGKNPTKKGGIHRATKSS